MSRRARIHHSDGDVKEEVDDDHDILSNVDCTDELKLLRKTIGDVVLHYNSTTRRYLLSLRTFVEAEHERTEISVLDVVSQVVYLMGTWVVLGFSMWYLLDRITLNMSSILNVFCVAALLGLIHNQYLFNMHGRIRFFASNGSATQTTPIAKKDMIFTTALYANLLCSLFLAARMIIDLQILQRKQEEFPLVYGDEGDFKNAIAGGYIYTVIIIADSMLFHYTFSEKYGAWFMDKITQKNTLRNGTADVLRIITNFSNAYYSILLAAHFQRDLRVVFLFMSVVFVGVVHNAIVAKYTVTDMRTRLFKSMFWLNAVLIYLSIQDNYQTMMFDDFSGFWEEVANQSF